MSSKLSAFRLAKRLGITEGTLDEAAHRQAVQDFLQNVAARDSRRLMWIIERACNGTAEMIQDHQDDWLRASQFGWDDEARKGLEYVERYTEDFRFLWALKNLLSQIVVEESVQDLAEYFKTQGKKPTPQRKKLEG